MSDVDAYFVILATVPICVIDVDVGSSASGSSHSQGGGGGRSSSTGSCHKPSLICGDDISEHCSLLGSHHYSLNGRAAPDSLASVSAVPQLLSSQHASGQ